VSNQVNSRMSLLASTLAGLEQRVILLEQRGSKVDSSSPQNLSIATPLSDMLAGRKQHCIEGLAARCKASCSTGSIRSRLGIVAVNCLAQVDTLEKTLTELKRKWQQVPQTPPVPPPPLVPPPQAPQVSQAQPAPHGPFGPALHVPPAPQASSALPATSAPQAWQASQVWQDEESRVPQASSAPPASSMPQAWQVSQASQVWQGDESRGNFAPAQKAPPPIKAPPLGPKRPPPTLPSVPSPPPQPAKPSAPSRSATPRGKRPPEGNGGK
jgi:hypothetical protein